MENQTKNDKQPLNADMKKCLLQLVLDDLSYDAIKNSPKAVEEEFNLNLANIIISTRGQF